ncbi:MAG TPA: TPM domain-containing protein [Verrucomicrobiae bacterium]|nr:TPM domain-containing protein [Verrucomicrobiae bacterium]
MNRLARIWRHLNTGSLAVRRRFPVNALAAIEAAVRDAERTAGGEIRFAVEDALPFGALWRGQSARERALEVFGELGVWDTADNDGVLIYLLLADQDVQIVVDRGIIGVGAADWQGCCEAMEAHFRAGRFGDGAVAGIAAVARLLASGGNAASRGGNELPDAPTVL